MFEWINANWQGIALVLFIIYSVASEAIGISNLKENAVIQVIIRILGRLCGRV